MLTNVLEIGYTYSRGESRPNYEKEGAIAFTKAVKGEVKAIPVVTIGIRKPNGKMAYVQLSLNQLHQIVTSQEVPMLKGAAALPKTREEDDVEGAKALWKWFIGIKPSLEMLIASEKLVAKFSLKEIETTNPETGEVHTAEYANIGNVFVSDAEITAKIASDNCQFAFEA